MAHNNSVNNQQQCKIWNLPPRKPKEKVVATSTSQFPRYMTSRQWLFLLKSSWRKWPQPFSPNTIEKKSISILYHGILQRKSRKQRWVRGERAYKARTARLRSASKTLSECAMNGTHPLMTKFGSRYLLVLSINGAWEAGDEAKPRPPALVLVIVCCLNSVRRGRVRMMVQVWDCVFGRGALRVRDSKKIKPR